MQNRPHPCPCGYPLPAFAVVDLSVHIVCPSCRRAGPLAAGREDACATWALLVKVKPEDAEVARAAVAAERATIVTFLQCEMFEHRYDPDAVALLRKLSHAIPRGVHPAIPLGEMNLPPEAYGDCVVAEAPRIPGAVCADQDV